MSDFRLYPVPQNKLSCIERLLNAATKEMGMSNHTNVPYSLARLEDGYDTRSAAAYVDNLEDPKHCIVITYVPGMIRNGVVAFFRLIYSLPDVRSPKIQKILIETGENFARLNGAVSISGSSWKLTSKRDIGPIWKTEGYTEQEVIYTKQL